MDDRRFVHLSDLIGYDNQRLARMFNMEVSEVEVFCQGTKPIPEKIAADLKGFADCSCVASHTEVKKELAGKHLNRHDNYWE